jgi:hypothetical protein
MIAKGFVPIPGIRSFAIMEKATPYCGIEVTSTSFAWDQAWRGAGVTVRVRHLGPELTGLT